MIISSTLLIISTPISTAVAALNSRTRSSGMSGLVQISFRFLPLDRPDAIEKFDFNEAIDSLSSDLVRTLQYSSKEDGLASETVEGATKIPSYPSADLNNLLASPETDLGAWRPTPEWLWS